MGGWCRGGRARSVRSRLSRQPTPWSPAGENVRSFGRGIRIRAILEHPTVASNSSERSQRVETLFPSGSRPRSGAARCLPGRRVRQRSNTPFLLRPARALRRYLAAGSGTGRPSIGRRRHGLAQSPPRGLKSAAEDDLDLRPMTYYLPRALKGESHAAAGCVGIDDRLFHPAGNGVSRSRRWHRRVPGDQSMRFSRCSRKSWSRNTGLGIRRY